MKLRRCFKVFRESETVELKTEIVRDICKEVIVFANTKGDMLYIGVRDDVGELLDLSGESVCEQLIITDGYI